MAKDKDGERTESATPKRREEARKKGQVAQSKEVVSVFVLFSSLGVMFFLGSDIFSRLMGLMQEMIQKMGTLAVDQTSAPALLAEILWQMATILLPFMLTIAAAGVTANLVQFGFIFTGETIVPKVSRLNPINGIKKMVSLRSLVDLTKAIFKVVVLGGIGFLMIRAVVKTIPSLMQMECPDILLFVSSTSFKICFYTCLALILMAGLDYGFQRWQHEKDLKMTKQEIKDEAKQREGDPLVKARIRSVQREMAQRRMMEEIPKADVIITNPTHLAIALRYNADEMMAPQVVAKGAGFVAERIKKVAREISIPIIENKSLAQTLYRTVEIGDFIPVNLYRAVAELLAYVYRLKAARSHNR